MHNPRATIPRRFRCAPVSGVYWLSAWRRCEQPAWAPGTGVLLVPGMVHLYFIIHAIPRYVRVDSIGHHPRCAVEIPVRLWEITQGGLNLPRAAPNQSIQGISKLPRTRLWKSHQGDPDIPRAWSCGANQGDPDVPRDGVWCRNQGASGLPRAVSCGPAGIPLNRPRDTKPP